MLVYLKPLSTFPFLHSDTIFGALCNAISELFPEKVDVMLSDFQENPPFIISSTFPCVKNNDKITRFYPKIITLSNNKLGDVDARSLKKYKKISYIEESIFLDLINGNSSEHDIIQDIDKYYIFGNLLMKDKVEVSFNYNELITPRNTINRIDNSSESIFYTSGYQFRNMGLYFIIHFYDQTYTKIVKSALKFLKDRGFGKNISVGKGQFDYEIVDDEIEEELLNNQGNYFVTLSRYIPTKENIEHINNYGAYEISSKRGRSSQGEIRKQVKFFMEGSTFPNYEKYYGQIIQSGIHTPAIEYGHAFPVGYNKCD